MPTAVNPQTGEVVELVNGQWVPRQATPQNPLGEVDRVTGGPFSQRLAASVKMTPQGKQSYLESIYGKGNVASLDNGEMFFKHPDSGQWTQFDEDGLSIADAADHLGGTIQTVPPIVAGVLTANPLVVGAVGAGTHALRQGLSGLLGGDDEMSVGERVAGPAIAGTVDAAFQGGSNLLFKGVDAVRPHNLIARSVEKSQQTPFAQRGELLQNEMGRGFQFSPGQLSGNRGQLMMEGLARQHPVSADRVMQFDQGHLKAATARLGRLMDSIDRRGLGSIQVGQNVASAFDNVTKGLLSKRRAQAAVDFGKVQELSAGRPLIETTNTQRALQELIEEFDVPGGGDATAALVGRLKRVLPATEPDTLVTPASRVLDASGKPAIAETSESIPATMTAQQTQRLLQIYGNAAKGSGQLFKDIDTAQQRMVASRVQRALMADLDAAAEAGEGSAAQALKVARDNYRINSTQIDELGSSVLGRLFGGKYDPAPEAIADKFLKMRPSEIKASAAIIQKQDPAAWQGVKRHMLQSAMDDAVPAASGTTAGGVMFSPRKFNSYLQKHADQFRAAYTPQEIVQVKRTYEALQRVADRAGMEGSQTAPLLMVLDVAKGAFSMSPVSTVRAGVTLLAPKHIARAMTTAQGRRALLTLAHTKTPTKGSIAAAAMLANVVRQESANQASGSESGQTTAQ